MMMSNLFSIFDPSLSVLSFSLFSFIFIIFLFPGFYWIFNFMFEGFVSFYGFLIDEIKYVFIAPKKGMLIFLLSVFISLASLNFWAMYPHLFSLTSHLMVTLPFSYIIWLGVIFFSWLKFFKDSLVHLIPTGTPYLLISFMVVVELLSNFIRPLALTFRLTANMMAGHLLMSLIGGVVVSLSLKMIVVGSIFQSLLVFMELGVSLIQAYVFMTLVLLYISEIGSH